MNTKPLRLLVVEDEVAHVEAIRRAFDAVTDKAEIRAVSTLREYRELIAESPPDLALVDLNLPDGRAVETLTQPPENALFPILVMTAFGNEQLVVEIMKAGALDYVVKSPEAFAAMPQTVARALREWRMLRQHQQVSWFLFESEARYAQLAEQSLTVAWEVNAQGLYTYVSKVSEAVWGYRPDELIGRKHFYDLHPESGREAFKESTFMVFAQKQPFVNFVNAIQTKDGPQVRVSTNGSPILSAEGNLCGYRGSDTDITERHKAETALSLALAEKTALIMEIHHRVKNNLAIMVSLINMQAYQIKHPEALAALADTKARLFSMSLLHEMLYSAGRMDQVEIQSYMQRLCSHISQSHGLAARGIQIQNSPSAPLTVGIDQAVPCGLIVSELISNTIKHAFPNDRQGKVTVDMVLTAPDIVTLRVTDDGIGLPDDHLKIDQIGPLGLSLVDALTHQLRGTLVIQRGLGTTFEIRFPLEPTTPA
jgi:PAS domain S-box-containing protein